MTVVTETLDLGSGASAAGVTVKFQLVGARGVDLLEAYYDSTTIVGKVEATVTNGAYSQELTPNDGIIPANTVWKRTVTVVASGSSAQYITVPATGGPYVFDTLLTDAPAAIQTGALAAHIAIGGHEASVISCDVDGLAATDVEGALAELAADSGSEPTGPAGGVLAGTYPNPDFATPMCTDAELASGLATKLSTDTATMTAYSGADTVRVRINSQTATGDSLPAYGLGLKNTSTAGVITVRGGTGATTAHGVDVQVNGTDAVRVRGTDAGSFLELSDARDIRLGTTTGTKIGQVASQKLAFFGATPIIRPGATEDIKTALSNLGLLTDGGVSPLDLDGGALSCGGIVIAENRNVTVGTSIGSKIGTSASQKLGFFNATPVAQPTVAGTAIADAVRSLLDQLEALGLIADTTGTLIDSAPPYVFVPTTFGVLAQTNFNTIDLTTDGSLSGYRQSSGAQNATVSWPFALEAGSYTFTLGHHRGDNRGIYTVAIDGVTIGTIDGYNATLDTGELSELTGLAITAGRHTLSLTMATKNASSSSFFGLVEGWSLVRTGA